MIAVNNGLPQSVQFSHFIEDMTEDLTDGVTLQLMTQAVDLHCGHSYNESTIVDLSKNPLNYLCPECRAPITEYKANYTIRRLAGRVAQVPAPVTVPQPIEQPVKAIDLSPLSDICRTLKKIHESLEALNNPSQRIEVVIEKATKQDDVEAQFQLGEMYAKGYGVEQSYEKAALWYEKAAIQGNAEAHCILGRMHAKGQGVEKSMQIARKYYQKAADLGHTEASLFLDLADINDDLTECRARLVNK